MNDYRNFTEYVVRPEITPNIKLKRVMLICTYTVFSALYLWIFWINFRALALLILLPFLLFAIVRLTWRTTNIEYEYAIEAGELTVAVIYGGASRRVKCRVDLTKATLIAPLDPSRERMLEKNDISEVKRFVGSEKCDTAYVCVYPDEKRGRKCAVIIETNPEAQRVMRICNPTAFISSH